MGLNPFRSWAFELVRRHRDHLKLGGIVQYRRYLARKAAGKASTSRVLPLAFRRKYGGVLWMREASSDDGTLTEVFVRRVYRQAVAAARGAEYVMDLGSNIGLSARYFACNLPGA